MSRYDNPGVIAVRLGEIADELATKADPWAKAVAKAERKRTEYELEFAKALVQQEGGSEADRKARALVEVADIKRELSDAEAVAKGCAAFFKSVDSEGGLLQSLLAKEREETRYTQYTTGGHQ
jgi:hypothetical protein